MRERRYDRSVYYVFLLLCFINCLGAYGIMSVPFPWIAASGFIGLTVLIAARSSLHLFEGGIFACLLLFWAAVSTYSNEILGNYRDLAPTNLGTPYDVFIFLRFLAIITFVATTLLTTWLAERGKSEKIKHGVVLIGVATSVFSIYAYFAQLNGWWEPSRNLPGTNGAAPVLHFTYMFHRAMGTFKEPSHNAEWLVLPFFLSFAMNTRWIWWARIVIAISLLLTGSLTGFAAIFLGATLAWAICGPWRLQYTLNFAKTIGFVFAAAIFAGFLAFSYKSQDLSLLGLLTRRGTDALTMGLSHTDRDYIAKYVDAHSFPFVGAGLGHTNLMLSQDLRIDVVASFLSLYVNIIYSLGWLGLVFLLMMIGTPIYRTLASKPWRRPNESLFFVLAAYVAWLIMYTVHSEQLSPVFGISLALLSFEVKRHADSLRNPVIRTGD